MLPGPRLAPRKFRATSRPAGLFLGASSAPAWYLVGVKPAGSDAGAQPPGRSGSSGRQAQTTVSRSLAGRFEDVGGDSPAPRNWFSEKTLGQDRRVLSHPVAPRQSRQENRRL